jgi:hypothetical protein
MWYCLEKEFIDHDADIEGVNIHYVYGPVGTSPDWDEHRVTRFMPVVRGSSGDERVRRAHLRLPIEIDDPAVSGATRHYALHYYFEIFEQGQRHYSQLYSEEVVTDGVRGGDVH